MNESNHPAVIALLKAMERAWPSALSSEEIEPLLAETGFALDGEGAALLMQLAAAKMIEFRAWKAPVASEISVRPRASAYSRIEARNRPQVTNLLHAPCSLDDPIARKFLQLLDGTRDRKALLDAMKLEFTALSVAEIEVGIEPSLKIFHHAGLLEA